MCYACCMCHACATPVHACAMHVQAEPKKEKKQRTATAAEKSLAQQNKEVLADTGAQVSQPARGEGGSARARVCGGRRRGAVAQGRGGQLPSQRRSGRCGRQRGSHGRAGAAATAVGSCQQFRARRAGRELSPLRRAGARLRGALARGAQGRQRDPPLLAAGQEAPLLPAGPERSLQALWRQRRKTTPRTHLAVGLHRPVPPAPAPALARTHPPAHLDVCPLFSRRSLLLIAARAPTPSHFSPP